MTPPEQDVAEALFAASELIVTQIALIQDYNAVLPPEGKAITFFTRDFPVSYVQALDELIHPPCFTACFVANPANASMWGTYGHGHTGVCLNGITGWRGGKGMGMGVGAIFPLAQASMK